MVEEVVLRWIGLGVALGVIGCSEAPDQAPDAGPVDAGDDDPCKDHPGPADSGVSVACNAVTGGRCNVANNETCAWSFRTDQASCQCSFGTAGLGETCRTDRLSCGPGLACLHIEGETGPQCFQICDLAEEDGCSRLAEADPANVYRCAPLGNGSGGFSQAYGICVVVGTACNPLDDRCDISENCDFLGSATACVPAGPAAIGERCMDALCAKGGLCAKVGTFGAPTCYQPCSVAQPTCATGTCLEIGYPFGICR